MKYSRNLPFHTRRDAWVEVSLSAIEHNVTTIRNFLDPQLAIMAVIKADAYGHGAVMVLPTLEACGVSMIGVAAMDEALQLRQAGVTLPILVLGVTPDWALHYASENDVQVTIFSQLHLESLQRLFEDTRQPTEVQIKVDTGMHRIGVAWEEAAGFITHCQAQPYITVKGVFSHFAATDNHEFTALQLERWQTVLSNLTVLPPVRHIANSAGAFHYSFSELNSNLVRCGISLFGYPGDSHPLPVELKPAMGLKARIVHLQTLAPGEGVSYGQTFVNQSDTPRLIATLPLGYADGVPRGLSNRIRGIYHGHWVPQVGNIAMDQLMIDVTLVPDPRVGDVITLLGQAGDKRVTLADWAT